MNLSLGDWSEFLLQSQVVFDVPLSMDGVQAADSGHPGTPMAMAPVAYCLWQRLCTSLRFYAVSSRRKAA